MKLHVKRRFFGETYTIGDLFIDGQWFSNTLEDKVRQQPAICPYTPKWQMCKCEGKVMHETAIPTGTYKVTMEMSPSFKRKLPYLHNVPHFLGILIHPGNTDKDSSGCILIGRNTIKGRLTESRATSDKLNEILSRESDISIMVE